MDKEIKIFLWIIGIIGIILIATSIILIYVFEIDTFITRCLLVTIGGAHAGAAIGNAVGYWLTIRK